MQFKIDENLPVEIAELLINSGHDAKTVFDQGLQGIQDEALINICNGEDRILVTLDMDFADQRAYPPQEKRGSGDEFQTFFSGQDFERQVRILAQEMAVLGDEGISADPFGICGDEGVSRFKSCAFIFESDLKGYKKVFVYRREIVNKYYEVA